MRPLQWWRGLPREERLRLTLNLELALLGATLPPFFVVENWQLLAIVALLIFGSTCLTASSLRMELKAQQIDRGLERLEKGGVEPELVAETRRLIRSLLPKG